ncbi:hypothetical protein CBS147346_7518 [Aspergillus niger]|nr:hypothetical protein CBS147346_7518 [Aspergillus niger]
MLTFFISTPVVSWPSSPVPRPPPVHRLTTTTSVSSPALRLLSFARFPIRPEGTSFSLQPLPHEDFHSCTDFLQEARDWLAVNLIRSTF